MNLVKWTPRSLTRWSPARDFSDFDREFERMMSWVFGDRDGQLASEPRSLSPAMDVVEEKDHYKVRFDLPGLNKEDIDITFQDGVLTLKGETKSEKESEEGRVHRKERFSGSFYRTLRLPETVDADKMEATFKNGVLELTLPRVPEPQARKIEIRS